MEQRTGASANPKARDRARARSDAAERSLRRHVKTVVATPEGRNVLAWVVMLCDMHRTAYEPDGRRAAYNEGRRVLGEEIRAGVIAASPDAWEAIERDLQAALTPPVEPAEDDDDEDDLG